MKKRKKKHIKIKYGRLLIAFILLGIILYLSFKYVKFPIKNIYIDGNTLLSDQEIIDIAGINNYPSIIKTSNYSIKKKLEKNIYIKKAYVQKKKLREVHIKIEENYPLYYDTSLKKTILFNKKETKEKTLCPTLINYIPDTLLNDFKEEMAKINRDILVRISEIKYNPNSVDDERFLLTMNDGNYVYLTLMHFNKINNYVEILKNFKDQKGILYLDSGEYFKVY